MLVVPFSVAMYTLAMFKDKDALFSGLLDVVQLHNFSVAQKNWASGHCGSKTASLSSKTLKNVVNGANNTLNGKTDYM